MDIFLYPHEFPLPSINILVMDKLYVARVIL